MASEIIRQGAAPIRGRLAPTRTARGFDRLRAIGAKGIRMAGTLHRELQEDLGGDDTRVDGKRVRAPVWLFIACILGAAEVGRLEERLATLTERLSEQKTSHSAELAKTQEEAARAMSDLRHAVDVELVDVRRLTTENQQFTQNLRENLIRRHVL